MRRSCPMAHSMLRRSRSKRKFPRRSDNEGDYRAGVCLQHRSQGPRRWLRIIGQFNKVGRRGSRLILACCGGLGLLKVKRHLIGQLPCTALRLGKSNMDVGVASPKRLSGIRWVPSSDESMAAILLPWLAPGQKRRFRTGLATVRVGGDDCRYGVKSDG